MFAKLIKKFFELLENCLRFLQISSIFLILLTAIYWCVEISGAPVPDWVSMFFSNIKNIGTSFRTDMALFAQSPVDFSFLISIFLIFLFIWVLKVLISSLNFTEKKLINLHNAIKEQEEISFNKQLEKEYLQEEYKNNSCLLLVNFKVEKLNSQILYDRHSESFDKSKLQSEVQSEFFSLLEGNLDDCTSEFLEDNQGIVLSFSPFYDVNEIFKNLKNILTMVKKTYATKSVDVSYLVGVETYAEKKSVPLKKEILKRLVALGFENEIICLSTFKQRYSLVKNKNYTFNLQGVFKICEEETVFVLKEAR